MPYKHATCTFKIKIPPADAMSSSSSCDLQRYKAEYFIIECGKYGRQREKLDIQIARIIGRKEWKERKDGEDRGMLTVLTRID